jgi:hypothetical protein
LKITSSGIEGELQKHFENRMAGQVKIKEVDTANAVSSIFISQKKMQEIFYLGNVK